MNRDVPIRFESGLLRCCILTLRRRADLSAQDGARMECDYCGVDLQRRAGQWERDQDAHTAWLRRIPTSTA